MEQIKDAIILEQFLNCLSSPIRVLIKESKPKSYLEAGQLADDYTEARKQVKAEKSKGDHNQKGKQSSTSSQEEVSHQGEVVRRNEVAMVRSLGGGSSKEKRSGYGQKFRHEEVVCFRCGEQGNIASKCPNKAMLCGAKRVTHHCREVGLWRGSTCKTSC